MTDCKGESLSHLHQYILNTDSFKKELVIESFTQPSQNTDSYETNDFLSETLSQPIQPMCSNPLFIQKWNKRLHYNESLSHLLK